MSSKSAAITPSPPPQSGSPRGMGLGGTVLTGLDSMIGTGVFVGVAMAADLTGATVLWAILVAAVLALCSGLASARLAEAFPVAGATYEYGYRLIGPQAGFLAGWLFIFAKSAIAASAALAFAGYLLTMIDTGNRALLVIVAFGLVVGLAYLVYGGLERPLKFSVIVVTVAVLPLLLFIGAGLPRVVENGLPDKAGFVPGLFPQDAAAAIQGKPRPKTTEEIEAEMISNARIAKSERELAENEKERLLLEKAKIVEETTLPTGGIEMPKEEAPEVGHPISSTLPGSAAPHPPTLDPGDIYTGDASQRKEPEGSLFLLATAMMFVAFTGFGRIPALGAEVQAPKRNVPLAIGICVVLTCLLYLGVAAVYVTWLEPARAHLADSGLSYLTTKNSAETAPLDLIARVLPLPGVGLMLSLGALSALVGVILNLVTSLSRMWLALGRRRDMPDVLTRLEGAGQTPRIAVIAAGALVALMTLAGDLRLLWSLGAFLLLLYYATTNLAAVRLSEEQRRYPKWVAWTGLALALVVASSATPWVWGIGMAILIAGLLWQTFVNPPPKEKETLRKS